MAARSKRVDEEQGVIGSDRSALREREDGFISKELRNTRAHAAGEIERGSERWLLSTRCLTSWKKIRDAKLFLAYRAERIGKETGKGGY